jgi:two-component system sensor kinase FixL
MLETNIDSQGNSLKDSNPQFCRAKVIFEQKSIDLNTRITELEKDNAEFTLLLKQEKARNIEITTSLSIASHDCRSSLTSIQLSASLIERYSENLDKQKLFSHLHRIKLAVLELTGKLNQLVEANS